MSAAKDVAAILEKTEHRSDNDILQCIDLALGEVKKLIQTSGRSLKAVCAEIEGASTKETLAAAFRKLNGFTRIFWRSSPLVSTTSVSRKPFFPYK